MLEKLWDDTVAGPQPDRGLGRLRKINIKGAGSSSSGSGSGATSPVTPATPATPSSPASPRKDNVWRTVFNPGRNLATRTVGAHQMFDKPSQPNSPTVYDWLYSGDTRSKHR